MKSHYLHTYIHEKVTSCQKENDPLFFQFSNTNNYQNMQLIVTIPSSRIHIGWSNYYPYNWELEGKKLLILSSQSQQQLFPPSPSLPTYLPAYLPTYGAHKMWQIGNLWPPGHMRAYSITDSPKKLVSMIQSQLSTFRIMQWTLFHARTHITFT